jgi:SAM-dependent methyltransferase
VRSNPGTYDAIGHGYRAQRRPDPRIAARIHAALGDAARVCNVGAGAGSYEPADREVIAVEPSRTMIAQRPPGTAAVVRARAEALPFADDAFDASMAVLTLHHWEDLAAGLSEMGRVAPLRVVFTFDPLRQNDLWLARDYLPEIQELERVRSPRVEELSAMLGGAEVQAVPVPWDCIDGFQGCYWRRPERYLDPHVQASISTLARLPRDVVQRGMGRLADDLASGAWMRKHGELLELDELDLAYRLFIARRG